MTQTVTYPDNLPGPSEGSLQQQERRLLSDPHLGPFNAWAAQRDTAFVQDITLGPFSIKKIDQFRAWYRDTLNYGGNWFASRWPLPAGPGQSARRFLSPPQYIWVPGGHWWVKGSFEVAGRGLLPNSDVVTVYYTSWPYPILTEENLNINVIFPVSGRLFYPPMEPFDLLPITPQSGTLTLVLHSYSQPAEPFDLAPIVPQSGTLVLVLHSYSQPAEPFDLYPIIPQSGTLVVVLVTYNPPLEAFDLGVAIPQSGTLT